MMDLHKHISEDKEEWYHLAIEYYYNIDEEHLKNIDTIVPKSISILMNHEFIPAPCIEIKIKLIFQDRQKRISYYCLYVNEKKEFIDEFLISDND
jgi:hypothetical protein